MKISAVICELNPLHNGHEYVFAQARQITGADKVLALMSGNFVQRAEPTVADVRARAECALLCGADAVIELPAVYATAAGDRFASGAIGILNTIPAVTNLVMGAENADLQLLNDLATIQTDEPEAFKRALRDSLNAGISYARSLTKATAETAKSSDRTADEIAGILEKPNNILAIAYRKALIRSDSPIAFTPVARIGSENGNVPVASASEIRRRFSSDAARFMPEAAYAVLCRECERHPVNTEIFGALILQALRSATPEEIASAPDCAEGLEYKIKKTAAVESDFSAFLEKMSGARFTRGRIKRICLHVLLKIRKHMQSDGYVYARLIGIRKDSEELLGIFPDNILKSVKDECRIPASLTDRYETEKRASDLYSLISHADGNRFYRRLLVL